MLVNGRSQLKDKVTKMVYDLTLSDSIYNRDTKIYELSNYNNYSLLSNLDDLLIWNRYASLAGCLFRLY